MRHLLNVFSFTLLGLALSGCPNYHEYEPPKTVNEKLIFVSGDPNELIAGAQTNLVGPITVANVQDWNGYSLFAVHKFVERNEVATKQETDLEKENETHDHTKRNENVSLTLRMEQNRKGLWQMNLLDGKILLELEPTTDGHLQPVRSITDNEVAPLKTLHWSLTPDGKYLSVLLGMQSAKYGRGLLAFYFERTAPPLPIPTTDEKYVFSVGPGKKIGWRIAKDKALPIQLCGSPEYTAIAETAVSKWSVALKNRMQLSFRQTNSFAPFSDLNQHCIYVVGIYMSESRQEVMKYGLTLPVASLTHVEYVDADVFIFLAEFQKLSKEYARQGGTQEEAEAKRAKDFPMTFVHELGHVLALGHKFKGPRTVMSYDFDSEDLQPYDVDIIHELYPLQR